MDGMKKKRRNKRKRDTNEPSRSEKDHAQRSDVSDRSAAEASRAQRAGGSSGRATGLRRVLNLRMLMVLLVAAVALYGMRSIQVPRNTSEQQDARAAIGGGSSGKDARVPTKQGRSWKEVDDPAKDGWDTEVFASKAKKQTEALGNLLAHPTGSDAAAVANLITDDFACEPLRPANLITVLEDPRLKIERASTAPLDRRSGEQPPGEAELPYRGAGGLVEAMRMAVDPFSGATDVRIEVKVFRVASAPGKVTTRQYFSISGRTKSGMVEQHATWDIGWAVGASGELPRMRWIRVAEFEQVESRQPGGALFADCTESVLSGNRSYADQFLRGMNYWFERIQDHSSDVLRGSTGLAVGDVNGDGLDDLYICQEFGLPNCLFIQNPDGSARDESVSWGVNWLESSRSALLVDLDNDSDQDLVVAIQGGVVVAENDGQGRFRLRDVLKTSEDTMSLSAVDYDMDGRLDIYVCGYFKDDRDVSSDSRSLSGNVTHDANNGGSNSLFRNEILAGQSWHFTDVTGEVGLNENNHRYSLAASWDDFDNDGDQDLYVANDYGRDNLYRNDVENPTIGGEVPAPPEHGTAVQFVDVSDPANVEDSAAGMSITWGDYDRDGWMDALVSNMWSSAGNRITFQSSFQEGAPEEMKRRYQRFARGNTLLRNQGDGTFGDRSAPAGVEMGRWAWGSNFVDLNNDGWEDLIVANGYITTEDTGDL